MPNLHRALEALTRLPQTPSQAVNELTASVRAVAADALKTLLEQQGEIERLTSELDDLREERALSVAVCPDCGEVTRCDEDRCCVSCGRDLIILADRHSADLLIGLNGELSGLRAYLKRSIAADIGGDTEAWEIIDGLSDEDTAMIDRWLEAMQSKKENP